jgi:hypothetical protein
MGSGNDDKSLPPLAERRPKQRKRVLLTGIVAYGEGAFSFDCTIRNLSETGARIAVGTNTQFPADFYLINVRDRIAYDARTAWTKGAEIGVIFEKALPLSKITDPKLAFLNRLWMAKATR